MKCLPVIFCCVVTFMCFSDIINSPVSHLFPACEIKLNISIVNTEGEGSGLMKLLTMWRNPLHGNKLIWHECVYLTGKNKLG